MAETDLDALRGGDETAFEVLVERHRGELLAHATALRLLDAEQREWSDNGVQRYEVVGA